MMTDLECFVEDLFHAYRNAPGAGDLKAEILSNMQARQADLMAQGYSEAEAAQRAMDRAPDVGLLLKGRRPVYYVGHYRAACAQNALLASVLFWIASLPLMFLTFPELSYLGLIATLVTGGLYWYWHRHAGDETAPRDHRQLRNTARLLWVCWGVFFLVMAGMWCAEAFGRNLWFGRPLREMGPYQFALRLVPLYQLLLTIVLPITFGTFPKLLLRYEKRDFHE